MRLFCNEFQFFGAIFRTFPVLYNVYAVCRCLSWGKRGHINIECRLKARDVTALGVQKIVFVSFVRVSWKAILEVFFPSKYNRKKLFCQNLFFFYGKNIYCGVVVLFRDQINAFQRRKVKIRVGLNNNETVSRNYDWWNCIKTVTLKEKIRHKLNRRLL